jgi:hypothetical protein
MDAASDGAWPDGPSVGLTDAAADSSSSDLDAQPDAPFMLQCDSGQPVQVCVQYYEYVSKCFNRNVVADACNPSLIPDGVENLAYIEMFCAIQLQRVEQACR